MQGISNKKSQPNMSVHLTHHKPSVVIYDPAHNSSKLQPLTDE